MDKVGLKTIEQIGDLAMSKYPEDELVSFGATLKSRVDFSLGYFAAREDLSKLLRTSTWDGVCWTRRPEADNGRK